MLFFSDCFFRNTTVTYRRDSFITHRAFCDALAQETSARGISNTPINHLLSSHHEPGRLLLHSRHGLQAVKREQEVLPWLACPPPTQVGAPSLNLTSSSLPPLFSNTNTSLAQSLVDHEYQNPNPSSMLPANAIPYTANNNSPHYSSATALLQKAAQMGVTMSQLPSSYLQPHMSAETSSDQYMEGTGVFGNNNIKANETVGAAGAPSDHHHLLHDMMSSLSSAAGFSGDVMTSSSNASETMSTQQQRRTSVGGNDDVLTRDFLGLRGGAFSQRHFFDMVALDHFNSSSSSSSAYGQQNNHNQTAWQG